jgi:hypothetical protein
MRHNAVEHEPLVADITGHVHQQRVAVHHNRLLQHLQRVDSRHGSLDEILRL